MQRQKNEDLSLAMASLSVRKRPSPYARKLSLQAPRIFRTNMPRIIVHRMDTPMPSPVLRTRSLGEIEFGKDVSVRRSAVERKPKKGWGLEHSFNQNQKSMEVEYVNDDVGMDVELPIDSFVTFVNKHQGEMETILSSEKTQSVDYSSMNYHEAVNHSLMNNNQNGCYSLGPSISNHEIGIDVDLTIPRLTRSLFPLMECGGIEGDVIREAIDRMQQNQQCVEQAWKQGGGKSRKMQATYWM